MILPPYRPPCFFVSAGLSDISGFGFWVLSVRLRAVSRVSLFDLDTFPVAPAELEVRGGLSPKPSTTTLHDDERLYRDLLFLHSFAA